MRLKLGTLQKVVNATLIENKALDGLREEVTRVLGPSVVTNVKLDRLAEEANYRIGVLDRTGRSESYSDFNPDIIEKLMSSTSVEARKLAAKVLPEAYLRKMCNDKSSAVRHTVARRSSVQLVKEMLKATPYDDELRFILKEKKSTSGIKTPEKKPMAHDPVEGKERLGQAVKQDPGIDLSDNWYNTLASKFIKDYGGNMEGQWQAPLAYRYCSSVKASTGVEIDEKKLLDAITKQLEEKDDRTLERFSLKEVANRLLSEVSEEDLDLPLIDESTDNPVDMLLHMNCSSSEYVERANELFNIKESIMPRSLRKYRLSEGIRGDLLVPCVGKVPGTYVDSIDESALDLYVEHWNSIQVANGEPIRLEWSHNPTTQNGVSFNVELRLKCVNHS